MMKCLTVLLECLTVLLEYRAFEALQDTVHTAFILAAGYLKSG